MPVVPVFVNEARAPTIDTPRADPGAFAEPGAATAEAGAQFGETMQAWQAQYAEAKRQSNAAGLLDQGLTALGNAQFTFSKVPDHQQAYTEFQQFAAQTRQKLMAQTSDPLVQAYVGRAYDQEAIMRGLDTRNAAFQLESSTQVGALQQRLVNYQQQVATAGSPLERAHLTDLAHADIAGSVAGHWLAPEQGSLLTIKFNSDAAEAQARSLAARDPVTAERILNDPRATQETFPGLLPEASAALAYQVGWRAQRVEEQAIAAQQHADAVAERQVYQAQEDTATSTLAGIYNRKITDPSVIISLGERHLLSPAGMEAAHSALQQQQGGQDDPMATLTLSARVGDGTATPDDVLHLVGSGLVSTRTGLQMMNQLNAQRAESLKVRMGQANSMLNTMFSAQAAQAGLFGRPDRSPQVAQLVGARQELIRRVNAGEDPLAVVSDIAVREAPMLPQPSMGIVRTLPDVLRIWGLTVNAHAAHQMGDTQYDEDALTLSEWAKRLRLPQFQPGASQRTGAPPSATGAGVAQPGGLVDVGP